MERVKRYIDIISSLFIINGKIESKIIVVKIKKSPEIIIDVKAIFLNSFLFFKKGSIKNKYNKPPYPKILRLPFKNVFYFRHKTHAHSTQRITLEQIIQIERLFTYSGFKIDLSTITPSIFLKYNDLFFYNYTIC